MCCFFSIQIRFSTGFVVRKIWPSKRLRFYWVIWPSEMQEGRSGLLSPTSMFWLDSWDTRITRLRWESLTLTMPDPLVLLHHLQLNLEVIIISWFGFFFQWKGNFLFIQIEFNQSFLNFFLFNCQQETHNFLFTTNFTFPKMAEIVIYVLVKPLFFD